MNLREQRELWEKKWLSPYATMSSESKGRQNPVEECTMRTCFQRDTDRIVHSKSFRRLMHKTQVFLHPEGDHYRTRMTHTMEVSRIARTIARALMLNEDLAEAVSLGHDLGHTPFGHAGEKALNEIFPGGFKHNEHSLRVVDKLENGGNGLNLSYEVRDGMLCHTGKKEADTPEGRIVRFADRIAYINHDIDDAVRGGILRQDQIPGEITQILGSTHGQRINSLAEDIILNSTDGNIRMSQEKEAAMLSLREFMFENVYTNSEAKAEEYKAKDIISSLYQYYTEHIDRLPPDYMTIAYAEGSERAVCDYIAGMTDKYAIHKFTEIFIPSAWGLCD